MNSFIYLPIEVSRRELSPKTMLAYSLSTKGYSSIIFEHTYFDRYGWKYPGVYLGKNFFRTEAPHDTKYYDNMKKKNINIWHLDEEGGVFGEDENELTEFIESRLDISQLNKNDRVYCWGEAQKKIFEKKNKNNVQIKVSGSPNFEVLKPKYVNSYLESDLLITGNNKNFILVNTRSVFANPRKSYEYAVGDNSGGNTIFFEKYWNEYLLEDSIMQGEFINLVKQIATSHKDETIVLRPHPEENKEIYSFFFKKYKNVIVCNDGPVDPWIRLSKFIIHYGCTTAIQADFAEKQVLTFLPNSLLQSDLKVKYFSNEIGIKISGYEDFKKFYLNSLSYKNSKNIWGQKISDIDTIDFLTNEIKEFIKQDNSYHLDKIPFELKMDIRENSKIFLKNIFKKKVHEMENFQNIKHFFIAAEKFYNHKIDPIKVNNYCYIIPGK